MERANFKKSGKFHSKIIRPLELFLSFSEKDLMCLIGNGNTLLSSNMGNIKLP